MNSSKKRILYNTKDLPFQSKQSLDNAFVRAIEQASRDFAYATPYASVACPFNETTQKQVRAHAAAIGTPDLCLVIGVGGSSLGFRAVYEALQDHAILKPEQVIILETVDTPSVAAACKKITDALAHNKRVHTCVISKSGITTETIALWRIVQPLLSAHTPASWHRQVTIITDADSPLAQYAQTHNISTLIVPKVVGGRYAVFSPVGLLPLALCGIPLDPLCAGAQDAITEFCTGNNRMPYEHAQALIHADAQHYAVHDTFIFSPWCTALGLWYRQLAAESLSKKKHDDTIFSMIPTVSIGSTDLHAIGQLYLSGASNFWTTFIQIDEPNMLHTSTDAALDQCVAHLNNRPLPEIMGAIEHGTMDAYRENAIPFSTLTLPERSPYSIGFVLQSYMLAIMYAGKSLGVNPFDQPQVERYKNLTRTYLTR